MFQKHKSISFLLVLTISCTACSFTEEAMDSQGAQTVTVLEHEQMEQPQAAANYVVYSGTPRKMEEMAKPQLYFPENSDYKERTGIAEEAQMWEDSQGNSMVVEQGRVMYGTSAFYSTYVELLYDEEGKFRRNFDELLKENTVETVSEQEAIDTVTRLVEENHISVRHTATYPLTVDGMTRLSRLFMPDEEYEEYLRNSENEPLKRSFEKSEEGYLVVMQLCVRDCTLFDEDYDYGVHWYLPCFVRAIVTGNGLEWFEACGIYDVAGDPAREIEGMSLERAKECLVQKFEGILSDNVVDCTKIEQSYLAASDGVSETVEFIPVYIFRVEESFTQAKEDIEEQVELQNTLILDMETGDWIE